jgi:hypothetical protein
MEELFLRTDYFSVINVEFLPKCYCAIRRKLNRENNTVTQLKLLKYNLRNENLDDYIKKNNIFNEARNLYVKNI